MNGVAKESGLTCVEDFYGEKLGPDLVQLVNNSPVEHISVLIEALEDRGFRWLPEWKEECSHIRATQGGGFVTDRMLMDHDIPLSARPDLDILLLISDTLLVADPIWAWAYAVTKEGRFWVGSVEWSVSQNPSEALAAILLGLMPLESEIRRGGLQFVRPPVKTTVEVNRLFVNPTTKRLLKSVYKRFPFGRGSDDDLAEGLDYYIGEKGAWDDIAVSVFPTLTEQQAEFYLRRAITLDDYAALNDIVAAPHDRMNEFFSQVSKDAGASDIETPQFSVPRIQLTLQDALSIRAGDETFAAFRTALNETLRCADTSEAEESMVEFSRRIRAVAQGVMAPVEEKLERTVRRGNLFKVLPGSVSVGLGLGLKAMQVPVPGAGPVAGLGIKRLTKKQLLEGKAAEVALRYTSNLRIGGGL